jgi:hypothetical protein
MKLRINLMLTAALLITSTGVFGVGEKTLEIQRYPNEPMELVDLRISGQPVKDRIALKRKFPGSGWSLDSVTFTDDDDWFKRISVTFRNVSDKPIRGVSAQLLFDPPGEGSLYGIPLTALRNLGQSPLQPREEVELVMSDIHLDTMLQNMKSGGVDPNQSKVSFSLDGAGYTKELQWYRGNLLQPDPTTPNKWIPVNKPSQ